eukprot:CAMPEP_0182419184 /NCGR_PEP_ID=MMETSP1167-20130531/3590_1 /TAXON_ID=2988 /ORGANISM="Mallomonas Sp, Strain CCMP3275" /LENGTH=433 /DNA_ID=CAMNT_0024593867 /DNA_START=1279 /DNA_END=2580 /DNA_ORIENTATION=-
MAATRDGAAGHIILSDAVTDISQSLSNTCKPRQHIAPSCGSDEVEWLPSPASRIPTVITLATQTTQPIRTSTLKDAFLLVSSQLTSFNSQTETPRTDQRDVQFESTEAWKQSSVSGLLSTGSLSSSTMMSCNNPLKRVREEETDAGETTYEAHIMLLKIKNKKTVFEASRDDSTVILRNRPFAQGGERNAYHMFDISISKLFDDGSVAPEHYVAKESRVLEHFQQRLKFHLPMSLAQRKASEVAVHFNNLVRSTSTMNISSTSNSLGHVISFLECVVFRIEDDTVPGRKRYLAAEKYIDGVFRKYNSNNGYADPSLDDSNLTAQAFSHFSYQHSLYEMAADHVHSSWQELHTSPMSRWNIDKQNCKPVTDRMIVCDIQGVGYTYTDPTVCSSEGNMFGKSDMGKRGFVSFFKSHRCNAICRRLGLDPSLTGNE